MTRVADGTSPACAERSTGCLKGNGMKHVFGFSGGIDSQAALRWGRSKFGDENCIAVNSDVGGHEHPITTEFIKRFSETVFPVVQVTPLIKDLGGRGTRPGAIKDRRDEFSDDDVLTFERLAYIKGMFPRSSIQFCTEHLKLRPMLRWQQENLVDKGVEFERYTGVRCDESQGRKDTVDREWDTLFKCWLNHPVRCWTKDECFAVVKHAGEPINPLYTMGFGRVGCAPCINSGKEDVRLWAARSPDMIDKIRTWEKNLGLTFFAPIKPGVLRWVDDVVAWSRTVHGGKQYALPIVEIDAEHRSCSSKYGLCE